MTGTVYIFYHLISCAGENRALANGRTKDGYKSEVFFLKTGVSSTIAKTGRNRTIVPITSAVGAGPRGNSSKPSRRTFFVQHLRATDDR
jgi:hypothetical protein